MTFPTQNSCEVGFQKSGRQSTSVSITRQRGRHGARLPLSIMLKRTTSREADIARIVIADLGGDDPIEDTTSLESKTSCRLAES